MKCYSGTIEAYTTGGCGGKSRSLVFIYILVVFFYSFTGIAFAESCTEKVASYYKKGQFTDLIKVEGIIAQCMLDDPNDAEALYLMGVLSIQKNDYQAALHYFDEAIGKKQDYVKALVNRADLQIFLKKGEAGLADYTKAISLSPTDPFLLMRRANVYMSRSKFAEAVADYTAVLELIPDHAEAYHYRALAYVALNQKGNMCLDFKKLCALGYCMDLEKAVARQDCRP